MVFKDRMGRVSDKSVFKLDDYFVWCGTMTKGDDGQYYLYFSFWPKTGEFNIDWAICSKIGYAVSDSPYGGFVYRGIALQGENGWDSGSVHNPAVLKHNGKYYMYYMGNYGNGEFWDHRNHQRIGIAVADQPEGPFKHSKKPILDISQDGFDSLLTSNPSVTIGGDGRFYMMYKAVSDNGVYPQGGAVVCGIAVAEQPEGPFIKYGKPIMVNPEKEWSVEDCFIWYEDGLFYALAKDFQGYFTRAGKNQVALFCSKDAFDWNLCDPPVAFCRELFWENGTVEPMFRMERPQMYIENGKPVALMCACMPEGQENHITDTFNVQIPIKENGIYTPKSY